ncbi:hypothetical protein PHLGIDRAFT_122121 [Phlebiopsis gigantea 11061_1 CR5-6]|uniref:Uncharacterized protein n=1 Tax=Phlebiopsis gigantea (strain 11061_1 CR5-6) TaxID=745531 RepID=A0A0C3S135_PHLG1|nr:hypothetical protein PHLGIDRAFT_122121 [Phlebiopsis gigantea 11061_1 CR5-6]
MAHRTQNESTADAKDSGNKGEVAVTAASKRKLSLGEPQQVSKKVKKVSDADDGDEDGDDSEGEDSAGDEEDDGADDRDEGDDDENDDEDYGDDDEYEEEDLAASDDPDSKAYKIDGPGPYVFFLWADAIYGLLRMGPVDDVLYVVLKSAATDAFAPVASLSEDEDVVEAIEEHLELVKTWRIIRVKDAHKSSQAKALKKTWTKLTSESHARKESGSGAGWWYEILAQREKPKETHPGIEVRLEGTGTWWFTGIQPTDEYGNKAMSCIVDYTSQAYD